ncbi:hypothetical protein [Bacillus thuringiensis]|uniref:hypothetical protein n=1 Tax=Bacillus thuringiensis TaxID=1428 RepID=UPI0011A87203|nr:hypothetical protein [Bacillus thuringiensis]
MDEGGMFGCLMTITIFGVLLYFFPIIMAIIILGFIIIGVLLIHFESKYKREEFLVGLKSDIPQKLRVTKDEVIYNFGEKSESSWKYEDFRIFTSRGEYIVKIKDVDEKDIELEQVSDIDFMKGLKQ